MPAVFISYRQSDSAGHAGRLCDNLTASFGADRVIQDVTTLRPGEDWRAGIERLIADSAVVVAVIAPDWDDRENLTRLHGDDDVLRWELEVALRRGVQVIPVLVNRDMPDLTTLPASLAALPGAHAVRIRSERWSADLQVLIEAVRERLIARPPSSNGASTARREDLEALLASVPRSRSPIVIAVQTNGEQLTEAELSRTARHLTITLTDAQVDAVVAAAGAVTDGNAPLDRLQEAGRRVWSELERAQARLGDLIDRIAGERFAQPIAWCGRGALLARLRAPLLIAHTRDGGFVSVDAGAHYFLPVVRTGTERTLQPPRKGTEPGTRLVDLRGIEPDDRAPLLSDAALEEVAFVVDDGDLAATASALATHVRANPVSPTRAIVAFGRLEPQGELVDRLLGHLACVSFADDSLAGGTQLRDLADAVRRHGEHLPVPCIVAAARASCLKDALERGDPAQALRALLWSTWAWVGLPLFSERHDEVLPAKYPHLVDLRSVDAPGWYFDRHEGLEREYSADQLVRADQHFHLYLSGAGGTGKSCFLRYVHDQIRAQDGRVAVWYRVDSPNSQWDDIAARLRELTLEALGPAAGLASPARQLGQFLRETADRLREQHAEIEEIVLFIDQLERTFESGDEPETWRLANISRKLMQLLEDVRVGAGVRIFIASRKRYLPDFLGSSRNADKSGLEFNVLQTISESNEQLQFVDRVLGWAKREQLVSANLRIPTEVASRLANRVVPQGHPLNMMLALIELLSEHRNLDRAISLEELNELRPWERLFGLDIEAMQGDDLAWFVLLAMAHARTEIVRFEEVWWRVRMVDPRLSRRADELTPRGIVEHLWLFGHLGRTIHARPDGDDKARFLEFFHANLRDFLLEDVMAQGGADLGLKDRGGTPRAWRALDRLSVCAHDWKQSQQLLPAEDVRALMEHRRVVIETPRALDDRDARRFGLLFLRDENDSRVDLSDAAAECFAFSALVHDDSGRWAFESLFTDAGDRIQRCRTWLARCSADSRPALVRYVVGLEDPHAAALIAELVIKTDPPAGDELRRVLADILAEPLFAARHRDRVVATLLESALAAAHGEIAALPERIPAFVVAACDGARNALVRVLAYCVDRLGGSTNATVRRAAEGLGDALVTDWLARAAADSGRGARHAVVRRTAGRRTVLGLALGEELAHNVDDDRLAQWSAELRDRLGVPLADLRRVPGDSDAFELELRIHGRRISTGLFRPEMLCVAKRRWGDTLPGERIESYDDAAQENVLWLAPDAVAARAERLRARDFDGAVVDWLLAHCRRSFDLLFDLELALALVRDVMASRGRSRITVALRELRVAVVDLVQEGVPFARRRDELIDAILELGPLIRSPDALTVRLRDLVKADICDALVDETGQVTAILLEQPLEWALGDQLGAAGDGRSELALETAMASELDAAVRRHVLRVQDADEPPAVVVLTLPRLRQPLWRLLHRFDHALPVLSFSELEPDVAVLPGGLVSAPSIIAAKRAR